MSDTKRDTWPSRFMAWLRDDGPYISNEHLRKSDDEFASIVPPAFGGVPPSYPTPKAEQDHSKNAEGGLVASARRLTQDESRNKLAVGGAGKGQAWQEEAWDFLDTIGELRFLANTLAGRMSQAALYVGELTDEDSPGTKPQAVKDAQLSRLLDSIGQGMSGRKQIIHRAGINLFIPGECFLVGIPPRLVPGTPEYEAEEARKKDGALVTVDRSNVAAEDNVLDLEWRLMSTSEVSEDNEGEVTLTLEDGSTVKTNVDTLYLIRVWRSHPRRAWEADSPVRASLPVLRELFGLTQHVGAQIDSRLAGAGILAVNAEVDAALKRSAGLAEDDPRSPLMEALTVAMQTPIKDRASAAAIVPLAVNVPVEPSKAFHHYSFSTPLDKEAPAHTDKAIRRTALGLDAPPELLLGTGGMNHWGAWLVREDVVQTHLEPPLALLCDAITKEFLRPMMRLLNYPEEKIVQTMVWYDVDHLVSRANKAQDAKELHSLGVINDRALREANGFEDRDAPDEMEQVELDPAVDLAFKMATSAASLAQQPGLPKLVEDIRAVLDGPEATARAAEAAIEEEEAPSVEIVEGEQAIPNTDGEAGTPEVER